MAEALTKQDRFIEAAEWFDRALERAPEDLQLRVSITSNLVNRCKYEEALANCLELESKGIKLSNVGGVLAYLGRFEEALQSLDNQLKYNPHNSILHFLRATVRLLHLDFRGGWEDYAYRGYSAIDSFRVLPFPLWQGQPLEGKKVVVLAEQGLGDQIMFASCLPDLIKLGPTQVFLEAADRIAMTLERSFPGVQVIKSEQQRDFSWLSECPDMDYYIPLGDLPRYFRNDLADFPLHNGFLRADRARVAHWRGQLEAHGPGPYIGLSWKGGTESTRTLIRTMSLPDFVAFPRSLSATWVCLQYGKVQEDVEQAKALGLDMFYRPESVSDLDEFAALVTALDLVVTVCNTTVHYAGALSTPVWVMAPTVPEWRYGLTNRQLPWYPSSTMFRQHTAGDWGSVVREVCRDLRQLYPDHVQPTHANMNAR